MGRGWTRRWRSTPAAEYSRTRRITLSHVSTFVRAVYSPFADIDSTFGWALVIAGGFSEGIGGPIAKSKKPCPPSQIPASEYEYDSDSDLEDEPETNPLPSSSTSELGAALYDYQQDRLVDHKGHVERTRFTADQHNHGIATTSSAATQHNITIPDVAFKTCVTVFVSSHSLHSNIFSNYRFQAFVYYAYTGDIQFAPLSSIEPSPANDAQATVSVQSDASLACSPKSMYRLADKVSTYAPPGPG